MEVTPRQIEYFERAGGNHPFREWLDRLKDGKARARIEYRLVKLALGNFGDSRAVGEGVIELKEDFGPGYRIYCAEDGPVWVVLLLGGDKSTQVRDISRAKDFWRVFKQRKGKEHA
jgi:putative addiction module killer protein